MAWEDQTPDGLWRDKRLPDGTFVYEAAPTTYFDHTMAAFDKLAALSRTPGFDALAGLDLG